MLKKQNRFHGRRSVVKVLKSGHSRRGSDFSVRTTISSKAPRIAVLVSKKVDKRAVVRNTIRRRIVSAMEDILKLRPSGDVVVIVHNKQVLETDFDELKKQLSSSLLLGN